MPIQRPVEEIRQEMKKHEEQAKGDFPTARLSSLASGLVLGAKALREGGIPGAILGLFSNLLLRRGTQKVDLDRVPSPSRNPWWHRFTRREAAIAKSQPVVNYPQEPQNTGTTVKK
jgi:hypothetical protein